jgi:Na+/phosphate symporter
MSSKIKDEDSLTKAESSSLQGVIQESATNIANVVKRTNRIYSSSIKGLSMQDLKLLNKNKKQIIKLSDEVDDLRDNIFFFIKNLDDSSIEASGFYINILGYLQDMTQSLEYISKVTHKHVNNNHKKLKFNQVKELKQIDDSLEEILANTKSAFDSRSFEQIGDVINSKNEIYELLSEKIRKQIQRTRTEESSPKNTTLYFSILLETRDLLDATMSLLEEYHSSHDSSVEPATINVDAEEVKPVDDNPTEEDTKTE